MTRHAGHPWWTALVGSSLACTSPVVGQTLTPGQTATIDAAAAKALADTGVPAVSIAVVRDGRIVYTRAYGFQRAGQPARIAEYRRSFLALGEPDAVTQVQSALRGGFASERFLFGFGTQN